MAQNNHAANMFEQFARQGLQTPNRKLIQPQPIPFDKKACTLNPGKYEALPLPKDMSTREELKEALAQMRAKHAPFLRDLAPELALCKEVLNLKDWLMDGEPITIPQYGGPLGDAVHNYHTTFTLNNFDGKAVFFRCKGADYIAYVTVNGEFAGSHEGFFGEFEFDITRMVHEGENVVDIRLENDFSYRGVGRKGMGDPDIIEGDKLYAYTGPGYDDPYSGWHHCPPGMGLFQPIFIEVRDKCAITDLYVQTDVDNKMVTLWAEVNNVTYDSLEVSFKFSLYGQNFEATVFEDMEHIPVFDNNKLLAKHGINVYKIPIELPEFKLWTLDEPNLYQMHVKVCYCDEVHDTGKVSFGMRSFTQDTESETKGMFYLNGEPIRLRGANTMGFEQQDVINGDFEQLIDDILLAKICNMNFWRITQRPVQDEVYEYCDKLGFMNQSDLPLFGVMRRNKMCEGARQTEEMIRLVRRHPSSVMVTYINEPWTFAGNEPHRHMLRNEMETFFEICDRIVRYNAPGYIIKHVDGDFDPPTTGTMPDVHCYTLWYNGGQEDFGMLYRGFGQEVAPGWYYGCGEFGIEGLDFADLMRRRYPAEWIQEPFDPGNILCAQSKVFHGCFFDTPNSMEDWVAATQLHQQRGIKLMTESYRRDTRMVSFAIHLYIDAWPSGWMKTIMDCERNPKPAYFAYRKALSPVLVTLRSDRFTYYEGETVSIETHICNDTPKALGEGWTVRYELHKGDEVIAIGNTEAFAGACTANYVASCEFVAPKVDDREKFTVKAILLNAEGQVVSSNEYNLEVFKDVEVPENDNVVLITELKNGEHEIAGETVTVVDCPHTPVYFLSRKTGHPAVAEFEPDDFKYWYDAAEDRLTPVAKQCFTAEGFTTIINCNGDFEPYHAVAEKVYEGKRYVISLADLRQENPIAKRLLRNIMLMD